MSYRVGTPNYNLPQTEGTDKRDWADTNQAFLEVDTALKSASDSATAASGAAATAQSTADAAATAAATAQTSANTAQTSANTASELAQAAKSRADSAYSKASTNEAAIAQLNTDLGTKLDKEFETIYTESNPTLVNEFRTCFNTTPIGETRIVRLRTNEYGLGNVFGMFYKQDNSTAYLIGLTGYGFVGYSTPDGGITVTKINSFIS